MTDTTTVVLVDDHELVRRGVAELLEADPGIRVVGEASTVAEGARPDPRDQARRRAARRAAARRQRHRPLPGAARQVAPDVRSIMLTAYDDDEAMVAAVIADAAGYVLKDIRGSRLDRVRADGRVRALRLEPELVAAVRHRLRTARPRGSAPRGPQSAGAGGAVPHRRRPAATARSARSSRSPRRR